MYTTLMLHSKLHLFDQKYSKNRNIEKYDCNLKELNIIAI